MGGKPRPRHGHGYVVVQCIGPCKDKKKVYPGEVDPHGMPWCERCHMPMVAVSGHVTFDN